MVIDKRRGVVITDEGLAILAGVETRRLNERARELNLPIVMHDSQAIDLQADLKSFSSQTVLAPESTKELQPIEKQADLKKPGRGGRRYASSCYDFESERSFKCDCTKNSPHRKRRSQVPSGSTRCGRHPLTQRTCP